MPLKVAVYDDNATFAKKIAASIEALRCGDVAVEVISDTDFKSAFDVLYDRHRSARKAGELAPEDCLFDKIDILVIDYDLMDSKAGELLTAETVAYNVRCFSDCGLILALNQFGDPIFDLTLKGHIESFADLNVGASQICNHNLWGVAKSGFRPWYWPNVVSYRLDMKKKVQDVVKALDSDQTVADMIGFPDAVVTQLSRSLTQFIGDDLRTTTIEKFLLGSGNAFRKRDASEIKDKTVFARLAAARLSKWLEQLVLPGQNVLVDAPHLVSRYPSILSERHTLKEWNAVTRLQNDDECDLLTSLISQHRLKKRHWVSRPVWFWPLISEDRRILEVSEPWNAEFSRFSFCEDTSAFRKTDDCTEFVADTDSQFSRRFVQRVDKVEYRPAVRFAM